MCLLKRLLPHLCRWRRRPKQPCWRQPSYCPAFQPRSLTAPWIHTGRWETCLRTSAFISSPSSSAMSSWCCSARSCPRDLRHARVCVSVRAYYLCVCVSCVWPVLLVEANPGRPPLFSVLTPLSRATCLFIGLLLLEMGPWPHKITVPIIPNIKLCTIFFPLRGN